MVRRWTAFGVPMPRAWAPGGEAYEHGAGNRFNFHVEIGLPLSARWCAIGAGWRRAVDRPTGCPRIDAKGGDAAHSLSKQKKFKGEDTMRRLLTAVLPSRSRRDTGSGSTQSDYRCATWARSTSAAASIEITGKPVKEVVFTPGGVPAKVDPNGKYRVEQMYVQYFLPQNKKGKLPLAAVARRRIVGRNLRDEARRQAGLAQLFHPRADWDTYISDAMERGRSGSERPFKGEAMALTVRRSVGALPRRTDRFVGERRAQAHHSYPGARFPDMRGRYGQFTRKRGVPRWVTTDAEIVRPTSNSSTRSARASF